MWYGKEGKDIFFLEQVMFLESYGDQYGVRVTPSHEDEDSYSRPANFNRLRTHLASMFTTQIFEPTHIPVSSTALRIPCSAGVIRDSLT